ncbi:Uncharacterized protein Rs2_52429 [Raphanus sativus]|nr:Uncharacterized protein Rs2_52429 [Raphanus sativus]
MCWSLERVALSILVLYMPLIQYVVALAVMEAVKSVCDKKEWYLNIQIKEVQCILVACLKEKNFLVPSFINLKCSLIYSCTEDLNLSRSFTGHGFTGDGYVFNCLSLTIIGFRA